jgi:endonuclease YncB( thermonuclease family)
MTAVLALPPVPAPLYENGTVEGWHDGDTVHVWVDKGRGEYARRKVRVLGAATRELSEPGGEEALAYVEQLVPTGTPVVLVDLDDDKYGGRVDAIVVVDLGDGPVNLADRLVADGWAMPWDGRGPQPRIPWPREEVIPC